MLPPRFRSLEVIADEIGIEVSALIPYGAHFAKVQPANINNTPASGKQGKLILVTAITPTSHGEGKTVTAIGLAQSIRRLGRKSIATIRQPSMGPVFGLKGGATGGGLASVVPSEPINLHFTGDFHAITSAHNLLSAMLDSHIFHGNELGIVPEQITWPRTMDMNDRTLRKSFVITAASEVMAVFALATSHADLRERLSRIVVGFDKNGQPVRAASLQAIGAMLVILCDALYPNLAQTTDGTPAFIHAGPFANIAHGTASVISQRLALQHADFVINEAGFGSDLGAEKYFDIVMPASGLKPSAAVVVATVRAIVAQGEGDLAKGLANLGRHLDIVHGFGVPAVVAINRFPSDTADELEAVRRYCEERGAECGLSEVFAKGAEGGLDLAAKVIVAAEPGKADPKSLYDPASMPIAGKVETIVQRIYGGDGVTWSDNAKSKLEKLESLGFGELPVCIAKTPMSFTSDPARVGAPTGWTLPVSDLILSAGAGFVVALAGGTVRMPGLGKDPHAMHMDLGPKGEFMGIS
jgi:formate--tetrahydrofolate ligase